MMLLFIVVACRRVSPAPAPTAAASQAPAVTDTPISVAEPTLTVESETEPLADDQLTSRAVPAPPHGAVTVDNEGPPLASLSIGWTRVEPGGDTRCALDTDYAYFFVTGCSAGSVGSRVHVPYVIEQYPQAHVTQLGDSLAFVFGRPINIGNEDAYNAYGTFLIGCRLWRL